MCEYLETRYVELHGLWGRTEDDSEEKIRGFRYVGGWLYFALGKDSPSVCAPIVTLDAVRIVRVA